MEYTPPTHVRITAIHAFCDNHGITQGSDVHTVTPLVDDFKDNNGHNIYIHSPLRQRSVWLNTNEYAIITTTPGGAANG